LLTGNMQFIEIAITVVIDFNAYKLQSFISNNYSAPSNSTLSQNVNSRVI